MARYLLRHRNKFTLGYRVRFVGYFTTISGSRVSGRKRSWPIRGTTPAFARRYWETPRKISVWIAGVSTEILTQHHLNTSLAARSGGNYTKNNERTKITSCFIQNLFESTPQTEVRNVYPLHTSQYVEFLSDQATGIMSTEPEFDFRQVHKFLSSLQRSDRPCCPPNLQSNA
jgi:hypothetical protein